MQFDHRQVQQPEVFGSRPVSWLASLVGGGLAMGGEDPCALLVDAPEKLDRFSSDLAFASFPGKKTDLWRIKHLDFRFLTSRILFARMFGGRESMATSTGFLHSGHKSSDFF